MNDKEVIKDLQSRFEELRDIAKAWGAASGDVTHEARFVRLTDEAIQACRAALDDMDAVNSMGIPLSCGKPLCSPKNHHPLCKLAAPKPEPAQEPVANEIVGCFDAAFFEGLAEALAETTDLRLRDLVERRLLYAYTIAKEAPQPQSLTVPQGMKVAYVGFVFDSEKQQHTPKVEIHFEPVPANAPNDSKGWKDRDAFVAMLAAAPEAPAVQQLTDAQIMELAQSHGLNPDAALCFWRDCDAATPAKPCADAP
jgi:hypothetical protein